MRYQDRTARSLSDVVAVLRKRTRELSKPIWFRGQANIAWNLAPTIARLDGGVSRENSLLIRFKQDALSLLDTRPADEWEWLFVMRHHGVPTRLMDWTENPLVGLYFAVSDQEQKNQDGALWHLLPTELNKLANLPISHANELPGFGDTEILRNYLPSTLSNEVKSGMLPVAALAPRNTRRMQAQQGVFTITHREPLALDQLSSTQHVWRLVIPHRAKPRLKAELEALNVRSSNLFPELDQVAQRALEAIK